jgi:hypothetical protein
MTPTTSNTELEWETFVFAALLCVIGFAVLWQLWVYFSPASRGRRKRSFDLPHAQKAIKVGWIAGVIKGLGTLCLVAYSTGVAPVHGVGFEGLVGCAGSPRCRGW